MGAAHALKSVGLRFIGVVKTAYQMFPLAQLSLRELRARGDIVSVVHRDATGLPDVMALVWIDWKRWCFVSTTRSTNPGAAYERFCGREMDGGTRRVALTVPQPHVAEASYGC